MTRRRYSIFEHRIVYEEFKRRLPNKKLFTYIKDNLESSINLRRRCSKIRRRDHKVSRIEGYRLFSVGIRNYVVLFRGY